MNVSVASIGDFQFGTAALKANSSAALSGIVLKVLKGKEPKLVYEWGAQEMLSNMLWKGKVEVSIANIDLELEQISAQQTRLRVALRQTPNVAHGMQRWDSKLRRRGRTEWFSSGIGCAAVPHPLLKALGAASTHELTLQHSLAKVQLELSPVCSQVPPPPESQKRPLSMYNQLQKQCAAANKRAKTQRAKQTGSDGERCDGCGDEDDLEDGVVCGKCKYTCCGTCVGDHCHGTCFCKR